MQDGKAEMKSINATGCASVRQPPRRPDVGCVARLSFARKRWSTTPTSRWSARPPVQGWQVRARCVRVIATSAAVGVEMAFPVLKNLELGFALRYDDYSDFGSTTNPKFSIRYTPIEQLLLRGSYNTGFAAPTLTNLYLPNSTTFHGEPLQRPGAVPGRSVECCGRSALQARDCGLQFQQLQGGNDQLNPEESEVLDGWFRLPAGAVV